MIVGAGKGLFMETASTSALGGTVLGEYWSPSTTDEGIPSSYLALDMNPPGRDIGHYFLQIRTSTLVWTSMWTVQLAI